VTGSGRGNRSGPAVLVLALVVVAAGACRGSGSGSGRAMPTTAGPPPTAAPETTAAPTTLATVPGVPRTTTTLSSALGPGEAAITGVVNGPEGPVPGATVQVERLFGDDVDGTRVQADAAGRWAVSGVNGGRYRLRAWRPPDLVALQPFLLFVAATAKADVALAVDRHGPDHIVGNFAPNPPVRDQPATLVVTVALGQVDADGILRTSPRQAVPTQLVITAGLTLESPDVTVTDGAGNASFAVRCTQAGAPPAAAAVVAGVSRPLALPACAETGR
jgi:hypothetical protein